MHYLIALPIWLGFVAWLVLTSRDSAAEPADRPAKRLPGLGWFALYGAAAACVAVVVVSTGILDSFKSGEAPSRAAWVVPPAPPRSTAAQASVPMPSAVMSTAAPTAVQAAAQPARFDAARIRVRAETGLRTTPSRTAVVLRVAHQGDVLTKFGAANGWIQVGGARPEGWVPETLAVPAG